MQNITTIKQSQNGKYTKNAKPYFEYDNIIIYKDDILTISAIPPNSIDLIVTSPPYNVDIHYNSHNDNLTYDDYLEFTKKMDSKMF